MDNKQALTILTEMQKWRRAQPPYDYDGDDPMKYRGEPYDPKTYGEALDHAIKVLSNIEGD